MPLKKSQLYSSLWQSCDELRGGMDASQYKDYILTLLFVKYVSDKYAGKKYAPIIIPPGGSFSEIARLKGQKDIGEKINIAIEALAQANNLSGVINLADFDDSTKLGSGQEKVDRLSKLIGIFEGIDLRANRAEGDDLLGDAYEYLMRHFAQQSGKSKGQFYTPAEVSRVMARLVLNGKTPEKKNTVYDPTCGSGSLLIRVADAAPNGLTIYGQEIDNATYALARMNTILHGYTGADIRLGNTLANPQFLEDGQLMRFDFVVANPPFSQKNWTNGVNLKQDPHNRFRWGTPPAKNGDYAFLLHILASMKSTGRAAVILPHGVLFRGNAEGNIRKSLVKQGYIEGIIGLPPNLFFGTGIPACIIVLDKEHACERKEIFFIDASKGFMKDGDKNRLRERDIHKIVDVYLHRAEQPGYSRRVTLEEIERNDFNLNIPRYIESAEAEDVHDLSAHLSGGIPDRDLDTLDRYWRVFPNLRARLFAPMRTGYSQLQVESGEIRSLILTDPALKQFEAQVENLWKQWKQDARHKLMAFKAGDKVKPLGESLAEHLLHVFTVVEEQDSTLALMDKYSLYQQVMSYWQETMQDDLYLITEQGWEQAARLRPVEVTEEDGKKKAREKADLTMGKQGYVADLIPPSLLVARYFSDDQHRIEALQSELDDLTARMDALREEQGGEDGLLAEVIENDKISEKRIKARLKELNDPLEDDEERTALKDYLHLLESEARTKKDLKDAQILLNKKLWEKYQNLIEAEIKSLVVDDKWLAVLDAALHAELERIIQNLAARLRQLAERYAEPLPQIEREVESLRQKVREHLRRMGQAWEGRV